MRYGRSGSRAWFATSGRGLCVAMGVAAASHAEQGAKALELKRGICVLAGRAELERVFVRIGCGVSLGLGCVRGLAPALERDAPSLQSARLACVFKWLTHTTRFGSPQVRAWMFVIRYKGKDFLPPFERIQRLLRALSKEMTLSKLNVQAKMPALVIDRAFIMMVMKSARA